MALVKRGGVWYLRKMINGPEGFTPDNEFILGESEVRGFFVLTADIVGGNSGSPVINRAGELVGLIFDGNLQGLGSSYAYDERQGRAIAVDARGIVEALRIVYGAAPLADELTRR